MSTSKEVREVVPRPVFGLGKTCMLMACMYGLKFARAAFHFKQSQHAAQGAETFLAARSTAGREPTAFITEGYRK